MARTKPSKEGGPAAAHNGGQRFTIGVLAREFDVTTRTIRFYEELGLLSPPRVNGRRIYTQRERVRMKLLLRGRRLGFGFDEIREILDAYDSAHDHGRTQLVKLLEKIKEHKEQLRIQLAEIKDMVVQLDSTARMCRKHLAAIARTEKVGRLGNRM